MAQSPAEQTIDEWPSVVSCILWRSLLFRVAEEVRGIMAELGHRTDRANADAP